MTITDTYLVVFRFPLVRVRRLFEPFLVLRNREEIDLLVSFRDTDDRRDKLNQELGDLQQRGVEVIQVVQD